MRKFLGMLLCIMLVFATVSTASNADALTSGKYDVSSSMVTVYPYTLVSDLLSEFSGASVFNASGDSVSNGYAENGMILRAGGKSYAINVLNSDVYNPESLISSLSDGTVIYEKAAGTAHADASKNTVTDYGFVSFINQGESVNTAADIKVSKGSYEDGTPYYEISSTSKNSKPFYLMGDNVSPYFAQAFDEEGNGTGTLTAESQKIAGKYIVTSLNVEIDNTAGSFNIGHYFSGKVNGTEKHYQSTAIFGNTKTDSVNFGNNARAIAGGSFDTVNGPFISNCYLAAKGDRLPYEASKKYKVEIVEKIPSAWDNTEMELTGIYVNGVNITGGAAQTLTASNGTLNYVSRMCFGIAGKSDGTKVTAKVSEPKMFIAENSPYAKNEAVLSATGIGTLGEGTITGIPANTTVSALVSALTISDGAVAKVCTSNGSELPASAILTSGLKLVVESGNGQASSEYALTVSGGGSSATVFSAGTAASTLTNGTVLYEYEKGVAKTAYGSYGEFYTNCDSKKLNSNAKATIKASIAAADSGNPGYKLESDYNAQYAGLISPYVDILSSNTDYEGKKYIVSYNIKPESYGRFAMGHRTTVNGKDWLEAATVMDVASVLTPNIVFDTTGEIKIGGTIVTANSAAKQYTIGEYTPGKTYGVTLVTNIPEVGGSTMNIEAVYINNQKVFPVSGKGYDSEISNGVYPITLLDGKTWGGFRAIGFTVGSAALGTNSSAIFSEIKREVADSYVPSQVSVWMSKMPSSSLEIFENDVFTGGKAIKNYGTKTAGQLKAELDTPADVSIVIKNTSGAEVADTASLAAGYEVWAISDVDSSKSIKYTLADDTDFGRTYFSTDSVSAGGTVTVTRTVRVYNTANTPAVSVFVVSYNENGAVKNFYAPSASVSGAAKTFSTDVDCSGVSSIKVFTLNGISTLRPLADGVALGAEQNVETNY